MCDHHGTLSRREMLDTLLKGGLAVSAASIVAPFPLFGGIRAPGRPYVDAAFAAERWIASAQRAALGGPWPSAPLGPFSPQLWLYHGLPGIVLFHLELHHATGDRRVLAEGMAGADLLASSLPTGNQAVSCALYEGFAGVAYTLEMTHVATKDARYRAASMRALDLLKKGAKPVGSGVEWSPSTDIIYGNAGTGLFHLWAHAHMGDAESLTLAVRAGKRLIERGEPARGGTKWLDRAGAARNYPNFSHGTAGVAYFLASLYRETREREFLDAAKSGATYLDALSTATPGGGRMVFHSEPGNEQLFYLGWCHGPAGTARLYHQLAESSGEALYRERVDQCAKAIADMHVPDRSPGFWNNVSQCCGNAGVTEFFIDLHRHGANPGHLAFAERVTQDTLRRGTEEGGTMKWVQAENRVEPDVVLAKTGLMQGAAGIGIALLHLDGVQEKRAPLIVLPDNPF